MDRLARFLLLPVIAIVAFPAAGLAAATAVEPPQSSLQVWVDTLDPLLSTDMTLIFTTHPGAADSTATFRNMLTCHTVSTISYSKTTGGKLQVLLGGTSTKDQVIKVTQTYMNYRPAVLGGDNVRVGIGMRMTAYVVAKESGLDVNLPALAIAASQKKVEGYMMFDLLGVTGKDISNQVPMPAPLTIDSLSGALQAMAVIKSKLSDPDTVIEPLILQKEQNGQMNPATGTVTLQQ